MSEELNSCMLKVAKGDKNSFRFIANALGYKMHATQLKFWVHHIFTMPMM